MTKLELKEILISRGFIDNEFLDLYLNICWENLSTEPTKQTRAHHIIPVATYAELKLSETYNRQKALKQADTDEQNIRVNLLYKDHLKAHAYLTLCTNLDTKQEQYDTQAGLRKRNSHKAVRTLNRKKQKGAKTARTKKSEQNKAEWKQIQEIAKQLWQTERNNRTWAEIVEAAKLIIQGQN